MPQWPTISISSLSSSRPLQLTLTFTLGTVTGATALYVASLIQRQQRTDELKASIPDISPTHHADQLTEYGGAAAGHESLRTNDSEALRRLSKEDERVAKLATRARRGDYDEKLIAEQLTRTQAFLTPEGLSKVRASFVVVVGLGGVGSHAVAALARSGVGRIRIIDFDQVTLSSLNRHALATLADVGSPKTTCVRRRLEHVCPWVRIDARNELYSSNAAEHLLGVWDYELRDDEEIGEERPDFVLDCIDNIDSKVALLQYCHSHSIKCISAMGAGCKSDPTRISVGDISASIEDPLSKATRRRLRLMGITSGIPVVFSTEKPGPGKATLLPIPEAEVAKGNVGKLGVLPDFRVRILPVLGTMPAVFGYTAANHVICEIGGYPTDYISGERGRDRLYEAILLALHGCEERLLRAEVKAKPNGVPASKDEHDAAVGLRNPLGTSDIAYLVEEVFRSRSVVSGLTNRLALIRWHRPDRGFAATVNESQTPGQKTSNLKMGDLVLMTKEEATRHEKDVLAVDGKRPELVYEEDVVKLVERRKREEEEYAKYR